MKRSLVIALAAALAVPAAAQAQEQYTITDANGRFLDTITYVKQYADAAYFTNSTNDLALFIEAYDPQQSTFKALFSDRNNPPCANGAMTDPNGFSHESWGLAQIDFAPAHKEFRLSLAPCGNDNAIVEFYGSRSGS